MCSLISTSSTVCCGFEQSYTWPISSSYCPSNFDVFMSPGVVPGLLTAYIPFLSPIVGCVAAFHKVHRGLVFWRRLANVRL